jgi:ERF superfamily protein
MQRSSQSIASLAAALAKAQIELSNPEKSLLGTIKSGPGRDGPERVFRYAPLSSGLEIVRKTLGQHEIATVQTTAIDQVAGIVNLTTVLAHASGEWIASDWPVCPISETATPHRMGAALTYARRYALFTLVGIAGEDDLDAPDLVAPTTPSSSLETPNDSADARSNGGAKPHRGHRLPVRHHDRDFSKPTTPGLTPEASVQLRDQLLSELEAIVDGDNAALWAKRSLPDKNKLTVPDAQRVEEAFQARLAGIAPEPEQTDQVPQLHAGNRKVLKKRQASKTIDKSVLALPEPRRIRDRDHVGFVAKQPCLICGRRPSDAHHLRYAQSRALGRKVSDEFTVPLCRGHHREVHHCGDEATWWKAASVDPTAAAGALWRETHPLATGRGEMSVDGPTSVAVRHSNHGEDKRSGSADKASSNYKTKPIIAATPQ